MTVELCPNCGGYMKNGQCQCGADWTEDHSEPDEAITLPELLTDLQALKDYLETTADQCWRAGLGNTTAAAFARGQEKAYKDALGRLEAILADHVTVSLVAADA